MKELVCKFGRDSWTVTVQPLKTDVREDFYELIVSGDGSQFHLIIGSHSHGKFLCIPKLGICCELDSFYYSVCNRLNINRFLPERDAETIVCVLTTFIPIIQDYEARKYQDSFCKSEASFPN